VGIILTGELAGLFFQMTVPVSWEHAPSSSNFPGPRTTIMQKTIQDLELFVPYNRNPLLAELTTRFETVLAIVAKVESAVSELKACRGERIGGEFNRNLGDQLTRERERVYEVAALRVELANAGLFRETRGLHNAIEAVKLALATQKNYELIGFGVTSALAQNNVICALALVDKACAAHHDVTNKQLRNGCHYFAINRFYESMDASAGSETAREWVVMSSGHGSKFRFDEGDGTEVPQGPYLTLEEAKAEASQWCSIADTIGGDAQLFNVRTRQPMARWY